MTRTGPMFDAMSASLQRHPSEWFALWPFTPVEIEGRWCIACDEDMARTGERLLVDGRTGAMTIEGVAAGLFGKQPDGEALFVFTNGITFARAWADHRAWAYAAVEANRGAGNMTLPVGPCLPGVALAGPLGQIAGLHRLRLAASLVLDDPAVRADLSAALLASCNLPAVV